MGKINNYFVCDEIMQKRVAIIFAGVILVFAVIAIITVFALHNHADRKLFIGIISLFASMAMYTSPIVAVVSFSLSPN